MSSTLKPQEQLIISSTQSSNVADDHGVEYRSDDDPVIDSQSMEELIKFWVENNLSFDDFDTQQQEMASDIQPVPNIIEPNKLVNETTSPSDHKYPPLCDPTMAIIDPDQYSLNGNYYTDFIQNGLISQEGNVAENLNMGFDQSSIQPLSVWPPFTCICCQVLRDIVHSNGTHTSKLEIHGKVGLISHATLEIRFDVNGLPSIAPEMIDFSTQSIEDVRQFLMQYCREREQAGFVMLQDPLLTFYSALCAGANNWEEYNTNSTDESIQPIIIPTQTGSNHQRVDNSATNMRLPKSSLAAQRERTRKLRLSDLAHYFPLPIELAAKKLGICPTVLKKICRKHGMRRWPHRKIKSMDRQISNLRQSLREKNREESALARAKIEMLNRERDGILNCMAK